MITFEEHEDVEAMVPCMKKPITVHAKRITEEFRVKSTSGNLGQYSSYIQGKPGDLLMKGVNGKLYICDSPTFEQVYEWGVK